MKLATTARLFLALGQPRSVRLRVDAPPGHSAPGARSGGPRGREGQRRHRCRSRRALAGGALMPTALPTSEPRLSPRETARFLWLCIRVRYLRRRMERASARAAHVGFERAGGKVRPLRPPLARLPRGGSRLAPVRGAAGRGGGAQAVREPSLAHILGSTPPPSP